MQTALYEKHKQRNARMVDFAGWSMPVQYTGIIDEHKSVRKSAGIFDVSHMGQLEFRGPDATAMVNQLITNDLSAVGAGKAQYTAICNDSGGILDDAISYKLAEDHVLMVVNASNVGKIHAWFQERKSGNAHYANVSDQWALLALQGPKAPEILARMLPESASMTPFQVLPVGELILATTGYTGEPGFEIFVPWAKTAGFWEELLSTGGRDGLVPVGLGARDTLRLEMKYSLYGNDIDETTNPIEAGLGWVVKVDKPQGFVGRDALKQIKNEGITRKLVGLQLTDRGIARHGHLVFDAEGRQVGTVTSGTQSPSLETAIALAYIDLPHHKIGTQVFVDIRGRNVAADVVKTPFYRRAVS